MDDNPYPILTHIAALRTALMRSIAGVFLAGLACLAFTEKLLALLRKPLEEALNGRGTIVVLTPHEYFFTELKAAAIAGIFLASPYVFYQLWIFVAPGLFKHEKKYMVAFVTSCAGFFLLGAVFCYTLVFPAMYAYFMDTIPSGITGSYSLGMFFGFAMHLLVAFGIAFEAPVIVFLLLKLGVVTLTQMQNARRYFIVIAFIIGALLTPPDPLTQVLLAVPLIILFELGLFAARIAGVDKVEASTSHS